MWVSSKTAFIRVCASCFGEVLYMARYGVASMKHSAME